MTDISGGRCRGSRRIRARGHWLRLALMAALAVLIMQQFWATLAIEAG